MDKIYHCPNCQSNNVYAGSQKVSPEGFGILIVQFFAGCNDCGLRRQTIQQVR